MNQICVTTKPSRDGKKTWHYFEWGKEADQRRAASIFTYTPAKNQTQRNHNKEAAAILELKQSQLTIEFQVAPIEITENLCNLFCAHLQDTMTGKTPLDYFNAFKRVIRAASKEGYFRVSPAADLHGATNTSKRLKDFLESDELIALINTPNFNQNIKEAFIFCCYTGLRWCDVKTLSWSQIRLTKKGWILISKIIQKKTGKPVELNMHPIVVDIIEQKRKQAHLRCGLSSSLDPTAFPWEPSGTIFELPTQDGCNKSVGIWGRAAGLQHDKEELALKELTWHSARLTFSVTGLQVV